MSVVSTSCMHTKTDTCCNEGVRDIVIELIWLWLPHVHVQQMPCMREMVLISHVLLPLPQPAPV